MQGFVYNLYGRRYHLEVKLYNKVYGREGDKTERKSKN